MFNQQRKSRQYNEDSLPTGSLAAASAPRREFKAELKDQMLAKAFPQQYARGHHFWNTVIFGGSMSIAFASFAVIVVVFTQPGVINRGTGTEIVAAAKTEVLDNVYANNTTLNLGQLSNGTSSTVVAQEAARLAQKPPATGTNSQQSDAGNGATVNSGVVTIVTTSTSAGFAAERCASLASALPQLGKNEVITYKDAAGNVATKLTVYDEFGTVLTMSIYLNNKVITYNGGQYAIRFTPQPQTTTSSSTTSASVRGIQTGEVLGITDRQVRAEETTIEKVSLSGADDVYRITKKSGVDCGDTKELVTETLADPKTYQVLKQETYLGTADVDNLVSYSLTLSSTETNVSWDEALNEHFKLDTNVEIRDVAAPASSEAKRAVNAAMELVFKANSKLLLPSTADTQIKDLEVSTKYLRQLENYTYDDAFYAAGKYPYATADAEADTYDFRYKYTVTGSSGANSTITVTIGSELRIPVNATTQIKGSSMSVFVDGKQLTPIGVTSTNQGTTVTFNHLQRGYKVQIPASVNITRLQFTSITATKLMLESLSEDK